jgi:hypothetical protein
MDGDATVIRDNSYGTVFNQRTWVGKHIGDWAEVEYANHGDIMIYTPNGESFHIRRENLVGVTEILLNLVNQVTADSESES